MIKLLLLRLVGCLYCYISDAWSLYCLLPGLGGLQGSRGSNWAQSTANYVSCSMKLTIPTKWCCRVGQTHSFHHTQILLTMGTPNKSEV